LKKIPFLFVLFFATLFPQGKDGTLLKALQNKFSSSQDFSVEFTQEVKRKPMLTGKLSYKKENMIILDLKNLVIVSDGVTNWNYNKKDKKVIISNYDPDDASLFSSKRFVFDFPNQCKVKEVTEDGKTYLELIPTTSGIYKQAKIFPNADNTIQEIMIAGMDGGTAVFKFSNFKGNQNFGKKKFTFQIPQGTKTIDLR